MEKLDLIPENYEEDRQREHVKQIERRIETRLGVTNYELYHLDAGGFIDLDEEYAKEERLAAQKPEGRSTPLREEIVAAASAPPETLPAVEPPTYQSCSEWAAAQGKKHAAAHHEQEQEIEM